MHFNNKGTIHGNDYKVASRQGFRHGEIDLKKEIILKNCRYLNKFVLKFFFKSFLNKLEHNNFEHALTYNNQSNIHLITLISKNYHHIHICYHYILKFK